MNLRKIGQPLLRMRNASSGQALVEYVLICVLVAILFGVTLAATGDAIGNIFSNTVYNLLGMELRDVEDLALSRGDPDAFWATVEWLANNPPQEAPIPDNPDVPPTAVPTAGPTPTYTPVTPSPSPTRTPTDAPSPTPNDFAHTAPWLDTIDNPPWWRVDSSVYIGGDDWLGRYYANTDLSGAPVYEVWNRQIGEQHRWKVNFDWPAGTSPQASWIHDNFSIRFTREIYVFDAPLQVKFTTRADDGVRLWIDYAAGCASVNSGGGSTGSDRVYTDTDSDGGSAANCLIIDNWRNQGTNTKTVTRTLQPGPHILQLDYYAASGGDNIRLDIEGTRTAHPNDQAFPSGTPQCNWTQADTSRANSRSFIWDRNSSDQNFPANTRCYLELRGSVDFSALTSPKLIFWDAWDLGQNTTVKLEVAEYNPDPALRNWVSVTGGAALRTAGSANYSWTRNMIDLAPLATSWATKKVTLRFVMENNGGGSGNRRWYVDDIEIRNWNNNSRFFNVCSGTGTTLQAKLDSCGSYWNLDAPAQKADFITTGRWDLTSARAQTGMSWDDSPNVNADKNYDGPTGGGNPRVHYIEFNGWVDLTGPVIPDAEGDDGVPQLSFFHAWDIGSTAQIAIQWTRDQHDLVADNWQNISPAPDWSGVGQAANITMTETHVPLNNISNWNTQPFRLRFALIMPNTGGNTNGWWIDNIFLNRVGRPKYSDYPFFDDAQNGNDKWLMSGQWTASSTSPGIFGTSHAFTDTPGTNYTHNTNASMTLRHLFDLNNDTQFNIDYPDNIQTGPATRPMLSFWFWRDLRQNDNFYVEWSKDNGATWTQMWSYIYNSNTRTNFAWERVLIDMNFLKTGTVGVGTDSDDDVLIRFRLDARNNTSVGDGIYIDDIRVADYAETSHRLWDPAQNPGGYGPGDNVRYSDDIDSGNWFDRFYPGGDWATVDYDQRSRLLSLSESPAPGSNTRHQTYSVMEMREIIDLRGVTIADRPTMYFWNHYYVGEDDRISVEVSSENGSYTRAAGETDYQRTTGWNAWTEIWAQGENSRVDTWVREQLSLDPYVGQRVRIRFVVNAYASNDNEYGWFVDDVLIEQRKPTPLTLPFRDTAQSLSNWIAEGIWGLAPDQWRGAGGGPASLGPEPWVGTFFDCEYVRGGCSNPSHFHNTLYNTSDTSQPRTYTLDRQPGTPGNQGDLQEFVLDIIHDFRSTGVPPGGVNIPTWFDTYAARWTRTAEIQAAGDYSFITISDDGVRMRWDTIPGGGAPAGWNIINYWNYTGRRIEMNTINFPVGNYAMTLEWFEGGGDATIVLSAGKNNFSFGDSPKAGNGPSFPVVNSMQYGNSSLILRRPLRLTGTTNPVLEWYTRYLVRGTGVVEVSTNGGFDWTSSGLSSGFTCPPGANCSSTVSGDYANWVAANAWELRQNNLASFVSAGNINLRFRLNTTNNVRDGWYITDIEVNAASIVLPTATP